MFIVVSCQWDLGPYSNLHCARNDVFIAHMHFENAS